MAVMQPSPSPLSEVFLGIVALYLVGIALPSGVELVPHGVALGTLAALAAYAVLNGPRFESVLASAVSVGCVVGVSAVRIPHALPEFAGFLLCASLAGLAAYIRNGWLAVLAATVIIVSGSALLAVMNVAAASDNARLLGAGIALASIMGLLGARVALGPLPSLTEAGR